MIRSAFYRFWPELVGTTIGLALAPLIMPMPKLLLWNASASAPMGLYRLNPVALPEVGDIVAIIPPPSLARVMAERHYLPDGVPLLKHVAALSGARVCRIDSAILIDGRFAAIARTVDSHGRPLPVWRGCHVLRADEVFLLNAAADSFDGRYFGALPAAGVLGRAAPILTRDTPSAPLVWRIFSTSISLTPPRLSKGSDHDHYR